MAVQIARVAKPYSEEAWLARATGSTVSAVRDLVRLEVGEGEKDEAASESEDRCTLTITADTEDAWLLECVRLLVQQMDGGSANEVVDALLGEASSSLFERVPKDVLDLDELAPRNDAQNAWNRQLAVWRLEAERLCEPRVPRWSDGEAGPPIDSAEFDFSGSPQSIDAAFRRISGAIREREVRIGELADNFWAANGWRRLGYATDAQYASERLGMGVSSVNDKRLLVCQLRRLPHLAKALQDGAVGYEAARLVAPVATTETDAAWTQRAIERTVVHLREDIAAAEHLARVGQCSVIAPPEPDTVTELRHHRRGIPGLRREPDRAAERVSAARSDRKPPDRVRHRSSPAATPSVQGSRNHPAPGRARYPFDVPRAGAALPPSRAGDGVVPALRLHGLHRAMGPRTAGLPVRAHLPARWPAVYEPGV
jgi:hypothetical protein